MAFKAALAKHGFDSLAAALEAILRRRRMRGPDDGAKAASPACPSTKQPTNHYDRWWIRVVALSAALILLAPGCTRGALNSCPRPSDQHGPRYEIMTGAYQSRGVSPGGGKFVTIMGMDRAAPISVSVTDDVFDVAGTLAAGTRITLVGYVSNSASGAQPPYSCIELAGAYIRSRYMAQALHLRDFLGSTDTL
jgi:hypothetical protein